MLLIPIDREIIRRLEDSVWLIRGVYEFTKNQDNLC